MNIKITDKWLRDYLDTDAKPLELQKYLSLCGPSVERIEDYEDDKAYDIEITSNRIDTASVIGIAQEAVAILPMFGKKANLKINPLLQFKLSSVTKNESSPLTVEIKEPDLCSRFTAILFDKIKIGPSPEFITKRLNAVGIKSINNVVDISNYLMVTLGQPVHTFDFDKIGKGKMIMRLSRKGEKLTTLDEKEITLPGGDIVIEDGDGTLIDLCGIMGGLNSSISDKTTQVLLFVQTYNKEKIRKTTMSTGQRTIAATYFEKGLDEERVEATAVYGSQLLEKYAQGKVASKVYDIFPSPYVGREIEVEMGYFGRMLGANLKENEVKIMLIRLGFKVKPSAAGKIKVIVPPYRKYDVSIKEDLLEEVARIYGYHNVESVLSPSVYVEQPKEMENLFVFQNKIKLLLKHLGCNEIINYSMVSLDLLKEFDLDPKNHLRLNNSISSDIEYLRTLIKPSLFKNVTDNTGKREVLRLFEIGKVYLKAEGELPNEVYRLGLASNTGYFDLKGIVEAVFRELNIEDEIEFMIEERDGVFMTEIDLDTLISKSRAFPTYRPINQYAVIKLDKTFELTPTLSYDEISKKARKSKLLTDLEVLSLFKNKLTLRFYYSSSELNLNEEQAKKELDNV
jgi:phenylalanyl-tRNA synthetase beta chain